MDKSSSEYKRDYQKRYRLANINRLRDMEYQRKYGITLAEYDFMAAAQCGKCAICGIDESGVKHGRLHVDHCHETNKVRGLLCNNCNHGLGKFKDNPKLLSEAIKYLEEPSE